MKNALCKIVKIFCIIAAVIMINTCKDPILSLGTSVDTTPPVVRVLNDHGTGPGASLSGYATIYVEATDDSGVVSVTATYEYSKYAEGKAVLQPKETAALKWSEEFNCYILELDTTSMADGSFVVTITASDSSNRSTITPELVYIIKNNPPTLNMQIPRPKVSIEGDFVNNSPYPAVITDNYLMGVFEDMAGIAPNYPLIKFWKEGEDEPSDYTQNAGWSEVADYDSPGGGWLKVDEGFSENERGEKGGSFRYYLREREPDGSPKGEGNGLPTGLYNLVLKAVDINGIGIEWPYDVYPNNPLRMTVELTATGFPPVITVINPPPEQLYQNDDFIIEAKAVPNSQGDLDTAIISMSFEVTGRNHEGENRQVILKQWESPDVESDKIVSFPIEVGAVYYSMSANLTAQRAESESDIPANAYAYVIFNDANHNFTIFATGDAGSKGSMVLSLYIDCQPPRTEVTSVSPHYSIDAHQASDNPNNSRNHGAVDKEGNFILTSPDAYRRWTVNSTVRIGVNSTDNRGTSIDEETGYMKFKYLFLKDSDIDENDFTFWRIFNPAGTFGQYLYQRSDAQFMDHTKEHPVPLLPSVKAKEPGNNNPLVKMEGSDGDYILTLQTHLWDNKSSKYKLWLYIAAMDNADNIGFQKILLNVDQDTDVPQISYGNINEDGTTFMDDKVSIRLTIKDDNGLDLSKLKYRFAVNEDQRNQYSDNDEGWMPLAGTISEDGLEITVSHLTLLHIACNLSDHETIHSVMDEDHKAALGSETLPKFIQIYAIDDNINTKVYNTDWAVSKTSGWREFHIDLTYPKITPSAFPLDSIIHFTGDNIRTETDPFGAPRRDGSYNAMQYAYGDIIENNLSSIIIKINGNENFTKKYSLSSDPQDLPVTAPAGGGFAVWRTKSVNWNGELRWRIPMAELFDSLEDGSHTFEISFEDKVPQTTTRSLTFYKDAFGPSIGLVTPGRKIYLDETEHAKLNDYLYNAGPLEAGLLDKYNQLRNMVIKDAAAGLIGTFSDAYSTIFSGANDKFYYKINNGGWQQVSVSQEDFGSNSVTWNIPLSAMADGVHRLSIRVMDSLGNGFDTTNENMLPKDKQDNVLNSGFGFETNLAFILDTSTPVFKDLPGNTTLGFYSKSQSFKIQGKVTNTFDVNLLTLSIDGVEVENVTAGTEAGKPLPLTSGIARSFDFSLTVFLNDIDLEYGPHNITISATGSSGQIAMATRNFFLDTRGPEVSINTTGGEKVVLTNVQLNALNELNVSEWNSYYSEFLYDTRIKDRSASAKLQGRFSDDYTAISGTDGKYTFWYKIEGDGWNSGGWQSREMTVTNALSKSVAWEIPLPPPDVIPDGIYRLSIGVSDRLGNGYSNNGGLEVIPAPVDDINYGYETNLAFMVDRNAPVIDIISGITAGGIYNSSEFKDLTVSGSITNTYEVDSESLTLTIGSSNPINMQFTADAGTAKKFNFSFSLDNVNTDNLNYGQQTMVISATGSSDQTRNVSRNFILDNRGPNITVSGRQKINLENLKDGGGNVINISIDDYNTGLNDNTINPRVWTGDLAAIYSSALRDRSANITLNFADDFSPIAGTFQYSINDSSWQTVTNTETNRDIPWAASYPGAVVGGLNTLSVRVSDTRNNATTESDIIFMVDMKEPVLEVSGIVQNQILSGNDKIIITGVVRNVFDVNRLSLLLNGEELDVKGTEAAKTANEQDSFINPVLFDPSLKYLYYDDNSGGFRFEFEIPEVNIYHGTHSILISVSGSSGKSIMNSYNIIIDKLGPSISFSTTGSPIYLSDDEIIEMYEYAYLGKGNKPANYDILSASSINEASAKLMGNFTDTHSPVFAHNPDEGNALGFWYKLDSIKTVETGGNKNGQIEPGNWKWVSFNGNDSISVNWQIPPQDMQDIKDGYYRLGIRVKDRLGNGVGVNNNISEVTIGNSGPGFENNLTFLMDRSTPEFSAITVSGSPDTLPANIYGKNHVLIITGKVIKTFDVKHLTLSVNGVEKAFKGTDAAISIPLAATNGVPQSFDFDFSIPLNNSSPFDNLVYGSNSITISAVGSSGKTAMAARNFFLDDRGPEISFNTTGGEKIYLDDAALTALATSNVTDWDNQYEPVYTTRVKDTSASAKLTGNFTDEYVGIFAQEENKYGFWYKVDKGDGAGNLIKDWTFKEITYITEYKSAAWEIPITEISTDLPDGIYRLSIRVKDRLGNGLNKNDTVPAGINSGYGFETNMAFMVDRSQPVITITSAIENEIYGKNTNVIVNAAISNTYAVSNAQIRLNTGTWIDLTKTAEGVKTFNYTHTLAANSLAYGENTITIRAVGSSDQSGSSQPCSFIVDTQGPGITFGVNSGARIYMAGTEASTINADLNNGTRPWISGSEDLKTVYNSRIKNASSKLTMTFNDNYSPVTAAWYKLNNGDFVPVPSAVFTDPGNFMSRSWDLNLAGLQGLQQGINLLSIRAVDSRQNGYTDTDSPAGNGGFGYETNLAFMLDSRTPALVITNEPQAVYGGESNDMSITVRVNNTFDVNRLSININGTEIAGKTVGTEEGSSFNFNSSDPDSGKHGFIHEFNVPVSGYAHGAHSVFINAAGSSGITAMQTRNFIADKEGPIVTFNTIPADATGSIITLDDNEFKAVIAETNISQELQNKINHLNLNSINDQAIRLMGTFTDEYSWTLSVYPYNNSHPNYDPAMINSYGYWYKLENIDNIKDGGVPAVWQWMKVDGISSITGNNSQGWQIPLQNYIADGYYRLSIRVKDRIGNGYDADSGNVLNGGSGFRHNMAFLIERSIPAISIDKVMVDGINYNAGNPAPSNVPSFINNDFTVQVTVSNTASVSPLIVKLNGERANGAKFEEEIVIWEGAGSPGNTGTANVSSNGRNHTFNVTVPVKSMHFGSKINYPEGSYSVTITATGASKQTAMVMRNFNMDVTPPDVNFISPREGDMYQEGSLNNGKWAIVYSNAWVTGQPRISGTSDDSLSGIARIDYYLGRTVDNNASIGDKTNYYNNFTGWQATELHTGQAVGPWSGSLYYWNFQDNLNNYEFNSNMIENDITTPTSNIRSFYLPLYVRVEDRAGNVSIVQYKLFVDPGMDIPKVEILAPTNTQVAGSVRISGTAEDNVWIHSVEVRITDLSKQYNEAGYYYKNDNSDWLYGSVAPNGGWILANLQGGNSDRVNWNYTINEDGKLTPSSGELRNVRVEVRARDLETLQSAVPYLVSAPEQRDLIFDSGVPKITEPLISIKDTNGAWSPYKEFVPGMIASGEFRIRTSINDEGGISLVNSRTTGNMVFKPVIQNGVEINHGITGLNVINAPHVENLSAALNGDGWRWYITDPGTGVNWSEVNLIGPGAVPEAGDMVQIRRGAVITGSLLPVGIRANVGNRAEAGDSPHTTEWDSQKFEYTLEYSINSTDVLGYGKTGNFAIDLQVYDNTKDPYPYNINGSFSIPADNCYPRLNITTQHNAVTANFYVSGIAYDHDDGSGIIQNLERVLVYFSRQINGALFYKGTAVHTFGSQTTVYFNPRGVPVGYVNNGTFISFNIQDNFYAGHGHSGEWAAAMPVMAPRHNVRNMDLNPAGSGPTGTLDAFPLLALRVKGGSAGNVWESPHAMVIDSHELSDTRDNDADGTFAEMWNVTQVDREWQARLDTTGFDDGELTVHYIVMDQVGNTAHYSGNIYVGNNKPFIRGFRLGTDINGVGGITDGTSNTLNEYSSYMDVTTAYNPQTGIATFETGSVQIINTQFRVRNNLFNIKLDTLYGNKPNSFEACYVTAGAEVPPSGIETGTVYRICADSNSAGFDWRRFGAPNNNIGTIFIATDTTLSDAAGETARAVPYTPVVNSTAAASVNDSGHIIQFNSANFGSAAGQIPDSARKTDTSGNLVLDDDRLFVIKVRDTHQLAHASMIGVTVDNIDGIAPEILIKPFYWKNAADNSLYQNNRINGHIELEADLPGVFTSGGSGLLDRDPKVSGKVSFKGTAYDNNTINTIYFRIVNSNTTNVRNFTISGADTGGPWSGEGGAAYYLAATYTSGIWTTPSSPAAFANNGWQFIVTNVYHDQRGHSVEWQFDFDSRAITGVASLNNLLTVVARDTRPVTPNTSAVGNFVQTTNAEPGVHYRFDVVPYISSIETPTRNQSGLKNNNIRSADGRYSIRQNANNPINVNGFNLNPTGMYGGARILSSNYTYNPNVNPPGAINTGGVRVTAVTAAAAANNNTSTILTNTASLNSGYLAVWTNGIGSLNNINDNDVRGEYELKKSMENGDYRLIPNTSDGSDEENMYNREADRYNTKNITLTDDRYLQFFTVIRTDVKNGYNPVMIMEGNNPVFGYVDLTGGSNGAVGIGANTNAGSYYPSHAMPQRTRFNGTTGARLDTEYLIKASIWDAMGMARDDSGRYLHATTYNRDGANFHLIYDRYAELYTDGQGWGAGTGYAEYPGNWAYNTNNNAIVLESNNYTPGLLLDRYQYPKLIAKGNSQSSFARYYMAYYDNGSSDLIFRSFRIGTSASIGTGTGTIALSTAGSDNQGRIYSGTRSNITSGTGAGSNDAGVTRRVISNSASKYFDLAVTNAASGFTENVVIAAFYDEENGSLRLRYSSAAIDGSYPAVNITWNTSPAEVNLPAYTGMYVSMAIDAGNRLHIAAFDAIDSVLKYIFIPDYRASDVYCITVDQYGSVGNWADIKLSDGTPYIAYYNATETGGRDSIKMAYAKNAVTAAVDVKAGVDTNGYTTGNWEYRTVPAIDPPQGGSVKFQKVNLGFRSDGNPVLGYLGNNIEFSYPVGE